MANTLSNIQDNAGIIAKMAAKLLADEMHFCKSIDKAPEADFKGKNGYSAGQQIQISKPARFTPVTSLDITSTQEDITEETIGLSLDTSSTVGVNLDSLELAYDIDVSSVMERVVKPAISSIAQDVEQRFIEKATDATFNSVGTASSGNFDISTILDARALLNRNLCPKDNERTLLLDSAASNAAVQSRSGLFQSSAQIAKQYEDGLIGRADGFNWRENELLNIHTNGNDITGVAVNDASPATGASTLAVDGLTTTTGTVKKGQVFTIAGVNAVHPITKADLGVLQQFVVTADATADGSGDATLSISPTIHSTGSRQNVSALHADDAALVFVGAASSALSQSLAFHKSAFRMASVPLVLPNNAEFAAQATEDGVTVAIVRDFDVQTRKMITRIDFLGGLAVLRPEWACRITA